jgi:probable F420-dependent oxidoreductase
MFVAPPGQRILGLQLPIQSQSNHYLQGWEPAAGPLEMAQIAKVADEHGFDWLGAADHVVIPDAEAAGMGTFWSDPIGVLHWIAAQTTRIRLLTYVYVLALRHPLVAAKQYATLDWLSGGRAICGLGAGHLEAEFDRLGADFVARGTTLNHGIETLRQALEHEFVEGMGARPRPVQHPRPPIWVSGSSPAAIRRAARLADGWLPQGEASDDMVRLLFDTLDEAGRTRDGFVVGHITPLLHVGAPAGDLRVEALTGSAQQIAETLLAATPAGVNQLHVRLASRSVADLCEQIAAFATDVAPLVRPIR